MFDKVDALPEEAKCFDFTYIASGEPHKNHRALVEAWRILGQEGIFPSLALTLDAKTDALLVGWIEKTASTSALRIENIGWIPEAELGRLFRATGALIYPSLFESFGLPLIEATAARVPIVAGELDYVRDVSVPAETFDPSSPTSIARAVKRFLAVSSRVSEPLSPFGFLEALHAGS